MEFQQHKKIKLNNNNKSKIGVMHTKRQPMSFVIELYVTPRYHDKSLNLNF